MPAFEESAVCRAPAEEIWKLLHDPSRFPEWWSGLERVEAVGNVFSRYTETWPDFAYPTRVSTRREDGRVTVSCLLSDIRQEWTLARDPDGCRVQVRVELPDGEPSASTRYEPRCRLPCRACWRPASEQRG